MKLDSMRTLYLDELADIYNAERGAPRGPRPAREH